MAMMGSSDRNNGIRVGELRATESKAKLSYLQNMFSYNKEPKDNKYMIPQATSTFNQDF